MVSGDFRSFPFDYLISTKPFILESFRSDGRNFQHSVDDSQIFEIPNDRQQGVHSKGAYYWHDYKRDGLAVASGWEDHIETVNQKYAALWRRFSDVVRDESIHKKFVITNSQTNLRAYCSSFDDYTNKFTINSSYIIELYKTMVDFGAKNVFMTLMFRDLPSYAETYNGTTHLRGFLEYRYTGMMCPPGTREDSTLLALSVLAAGLRGEEGMPRIADIAGFYEGGFQILELSTGNGIVYLRQNGETRLCAEISVYRDAFLFMFEAEAMPEPKTAALEDGRLRFSDNTIWRRQ